MAELWNIIGKILWSKHRDMFTVKLGADLLLIKAGLVPGSIPGKLLGFILRGVFGFVADTGVFVMDITLDSLKEGAKIPEYKKSAEAAYKVATAKVYDEAKKEKIRKQYMDIVSKIGVVGDGTK